MKRIKLLLLLLLVQCSCEKEEMLINPYIVSPGAAPVNSVAPLLTGYTGAGNTISVSNGTWLNSPTGYTYQWKNNGVDIGGATSSTYTTSSADIGDVITCVVTASNAAGSASQASSNSFTIIDAVNDLFSSSDLGLWLDWSTPTGKTFVSGSDDKDVSINVSRDANGYSFAPVEAGREIRQGPKIAYIGDLNYAQHASSTALYNYLHDGTTDVEIIFRFTPITTSTTTEYKIFNNNAGTSAQTGIAITYDNRSSQSRTNALCIFVTKSSAGNFVYNAVFNNFFTPGTLVTVRIRISGTTLSVYQDDSTTAFGTSSRLNTPVTSDASGSLTLFRVSNAATFARRCLTKDFIVVKRTLTNQEVSDVHTYLSTNSSETFGSLGNANVYSANGQSNMAGDATASVNPPNDYRNLMTKGYYFGHPGSGGATSVPNAGQKVKRGQWNNNPPDTRTGGDLSFMVNMDNNADAPITFMAKYSVTGTALVRPGGTRISNPDWNVLAGVSNDCLPLAMSVLKWTMDEVKYVFDYTPVYRGMLWRQGESEAFVGVGEAEYQAEFEKLCKYISDAVASWGYSMSKARVYVSYISNAGYSPSRPTMADIDAALLATESSSTGVRGDWIGFEYADTSGISVATDGTHFSGSGQITHGDLLYALAEPFIDE